MPICLIPSNSSVTKASFCKKAETQSTSCQGSLNVPLLILHICKMDEQAI